MEKTALQCWDRIKGITSTYEMGAHCKLGNDPYYRVEVSTIEKSLKALEFLKNNLNIEFEIMDNRCFINIVFDRFYARQELPKQEFDLLKEVLR